MSLWQSNETHFPSVSTNISRRGGSHSSARLSVSAVEMGLKSVPRGLITTRLPFCWSCCPTAVAKQEPSTTIAPFGGRAGRFGVSTAVYIVCLGMVAWLVAGAGCFCEGSGAIHLPI